MLKRYHRQMDWFDPNKHSVNVTVIGAGGIGGPTVLALAKLGVKRVRVFDFDNVEEHNQPNQIYGGAYVGEPKVYALKSVVDRLADCRVHVVNRRLRASDALSGIVIGAVDSMDSRRLIWDTIKKNAVSVPLYIDGRLGGQVIRVLSVRPQNRRDSASYAETLVPEYKVAPLKCTAAGIIDVSFAVAALICRAYRLWCTDKERIGDLFYDHRNLGFFKR